MGSKSKDTPALDRTGDSFESVREVCLVCLQNKHRRINKSGCSFERKVSYQSSYHRFLDFCVQYLKVDVTTVNALTKEGLCGTQFIDSSAESCFCSTCEQMIETILKIFSDWTDVRVKLLGRVNELGLKISKSSDGCHVATNVMNFFRDEVERKCFTKAQIVQPFIQLNSVKTGTSNTKVDRLPRVPELHRGNNNIKDTYSDGESRKKAERENNQISDNDYDLDDAQDDFSNPVWSPPPGTEKATKSVRTRITTNSNTRIRRKLRSNKVLKVPDNIFSSNSRDFDADVEKSLLSSTGKKNKRRKSTSAIGTRPRYYYKCSECKIKIRKRVKFFEHNITVHEGRDINKFLECVVCQEKLGDILELQNHLSKHEQDQDDKNIFCVHCSQSFTTQQLADLHRRFTHTICPQILCEVNDCTSKFMLVPDYNEHLKCHLTFDGELEKIHYCAQCGRGFTGVRQLELHRLYHIPKNDEGYHVCPFAACEKNNKYRNVNKLVAHYNKVHLTKKDQLELYRCDQCKKCPFFIFRKDLLIHMKSHTKEIQCLFCNEVFVGHNALKVHHFNKHPDEFKGNLIASQRQKDVIIKNEFPPAIDIDQISSGNPEDLNIMYRTCPYCSKKFLTFLEMAKHKAVEHDIHLSTRPSSIQCELCGLTISKGQLTRHMMCHKEPHLPCPYPPCPKKFRREENLKMHVKKLHDRKESDRAFICDTCGKRYLSRGILNRHVKEQHMKLYPCHLCSRAFSTTGRVNEHMRAAHSNEKFQCKWCPSEYGWLTKLKAHCKKKHPEQAHLVKHFYNYAMKPKIVQNMTEQPMDLEGDQSTVITPPLPTMEVEQDEFSLEMSS